MEEKAACKGRRDKTADVIRWRGEGCKDWREGKKRRRESIGGDDDDDDDDDEREYDEERKGR